MISKNLLLGAVLLAGAATASAAKFPTSVSPYPYPTQDVTSKEQMNNVNVTFYSMTPANFSVKEGAVAYIEYQATGTQITSTAITYDPSESTFACIPHIKFPNLTENGSFYLIIPAGTFIYDGESSPEYEIAYNYVDIPGLGNEESMLKLVSVDPAENSALPYYGGRTITYQTSDNSKVNFLEWQMWDMNSEENNGEPQMLAMNNMNRWTLNGNKLSGTDNTPATEDQWINGIAVKLGGNPDATIMYEGHEYQLRVKMYEMGLTPTSDYDVLPAPYEYQATLCGEFTTVFNGQTKPYQFSTVTITTNPTDPNNYEIDSMKHNKIYVTASAPIDITRFQISTGPGSTASAGTYTATNAEKTEWTLEFSESVLKESTGTIIWSFAAKDADGYVVKGNSGVNAASCFLYSTECNLGAAELTLLSPSEDEMLEEISSITIGNSDNLAMSNGYQSKPEIRTLQGEVVRTLEFPDDSELGGKSITFQVTPAITEGGVYVVFFPKWAITLGTEMSGSSSRTTTFRLTVSDKGTADLDPTLNPETVDPAEGDVKSIKNVTLTFPEGTIVTIPSYDVNGRTTQLKASLYKVDAARNQVLLEEATPEFDFDVLELCLIKFKNEYTEAGTYVLEIPEGAISHGDSKKVNPALSYTYTIAEDPGVGVETVETAEALRGDVYTTAGVLVLRNADAEAVKTLERGIYIINGKKFVVK